MPFLIAVRTALQNFVALLAVSLKNLKRCRHRLQNARTGRTMSSCNQLEQAATCPAATCLNRRQHVQLQHARTGGNLSGCNMLEQVATCPAPTCLNRQELVRLQHAQTGRNLLGSNMLEQATTCRTGDNSA